MKELTFIADRQGEMRKLTPAERAKRVDSSPNVVGAGRFPAPDRAGKMVDTTNMPRKG